MDNHIEGNERAQRRGLPVKERSGLRFKPLCAALIAAIALGACGGGGGSTVASDGTTGGTGSGGTGGTGTGGTGTGGTGGIGTGGTGTGDTGTGGTGSTGTGGTGTGGTGTGGTGTGGTGTGGTGTGGTDTGGTGTGGTGTGGTGTGGTGTGDTGTGGTGTGDSGTGGTGTGDTAATTMQCVDGTSYQCSGAAIIRTDNGVGMSASGVQVYGKSTSDLAANNTMKTGATGFMLESGSGVAEVRVEKSSSGSVSSAAVLLRNLGLSWDGRTERPPIIETFRTTMGRVQLDAAGRLTGMSLPDPSDLNFYDFATRGSSGTQGNYANNVYFPRIGNPPRCDADVDPCPTVETIGVQNTAGNWRTGGVTPDWVFGERLHEDGDVHAGNGEPGPGGTTTILPGGNGVGVPFPGSKGYRHLSNWGYTHANLATWITQDTVLLEEWAAQGNEHNKNRRGIVAFGAVTNPTLVPTTGTATYSGIAYGWYGRGLQEEPPVFQGTATVTVNFATRQAVVTVQNTTADNAAVSAAFSATAALGASGSNLANYLTTAVGSGTLTGGVGGRLFGPVTSGGSGTGPAEIAGAFRLSGSGGTAIIGGFLGRKQ